MRNLIEWISEKIYTPREVFIYDEELDMMISMSGAMLKERDKQYKKQQKKENRKQRINSHLPKSKKNYTKIFVKSENGKLRETIVEVPDDSKS